MKDYLLENGLVKIRLHYGRELMIEKCKEELLELIEAINNNDFENVHEEVADVYNILEHLKVYYSITDDEIVERQKYKANRQLKRIKQGK